MRLPEPPLLIVTDRRQARLPLAEVVRAALAAGCRWVSVREKDLSDEDQITLAATLLPIARRYDARLTLHGEPALAKACGVDGVHLPAGSDAAAGRAVLGPDKLIGVSLHTVRAAEVLAAGPAGIAVMGGIMRAVDPGREVSALLAIVADAPRHPRPR
jgi:thiamine-phosphate pyrophosphorylase